MGQMICPVHHRQQHWQRGQGHSGNSGNATLANTNNIGIDQVLQLQVQHTAMCTPPVIDVAEFDG